MSKLVVYSDGGSRGNPGPSASAFAFFVGDKLVHQQAKFLGSATNNEAEYQAVLLAFGWLVTQKYSGELTYYLDSELVTRQLSGIYKVRNPKLAALVIAIKKLEHQTGLRVSYTAIPREDNKLADALVNQELDKKLGVS